MLMRTLQTHGTVTCVQRPVHQHLHLQLVRFQKLLRTHAEVVNYLLTKYATAQGIAKNDGGIFCYAQSSGLTPHKYTNDLVAKFCKVADFYDGSALNDVFIEDVNVSIRHVLRKYWAS